ncbi:TetR/AcrR family transcriptional regulator [Nonomuraea rhodomycinica]|uniref:TetR/AcrR family transcriptional regulator n=1 Tax=Nonomuraea rhodomycinica TaxID=1712872 RepID=UPI0028AE314B|nr:TetR/AcrR family transcriptional regulator C-terminal domain-containing protein [Nonomuraea rhodomycinica]
MATDDITTTTGDRRVRRTRTALARALIKLVEEHDLSRISVSDVAAGAEVSRSAFYDHYRDVHELAEDACTAMIDSLLEALPVPTHGSADMEEEATRSLTAFFASLAEHAGLYRALLGPQGSPRVADHIRRRIAAVTHDHLTGTGGDSTPQQVPHDVAAAFIAGALIGVAADWLQRGRPRPPAEMAAATWPLLNAYYRADLTSAVSVPRPPGESAG